ncbi:MAG: septal ring lytic transglycosylase RlpA family protein [Syntrophales bacterium]
MTTIPILKKRAFWPALVLCALAIGSAALWLGDRPADAVRGPAGEMTSQPQQHDFLTAARLPRYAPAAAAEVIASWYGAWHHNKPTATGERFDMYKNTLAHRTLPLGTRVRLVNRDNGRSAEGIVNDRGPYIKGRDVDVSYAMAQQLGFVEQGIIKLSMETM